MVTLTVNGKTVTLDVSPDTPILWAVRDHLDLTGTKFGCGMALCGACTVHLDGEAIRSCITPVSQAAGKKVTTIEAMERTAIGRAVQDAWVELDVAQCGYCQCGQVMAAAALLARNRAPSDADINAALTGNICRCGAYPRIRAAVHLASRKLPARP